MPRRKSAVSLKKLCLEIVSQNINTLQNEVKRLPKPFINDLYHECYIHYQSLYWKMFLPKLCADLFLTAKTDEIYSLNYFDRPENEVVDRIRRFCKNLRTVNLIIENADFISEITINNPHILKMDLNETNCTDHHLSIIGEHCPQLQELSLLFCRDITDNGIDFLPQKLEILVLPFQITLEGQLNALRRLLRLKMFGHLHEWGEIIEALIKSHCNRTYQIDKIGIDLHVPIIYDNLPTIVRLFPKLYQVYAGLQCSIGSRFALFFEVANCNLLTSLSVNVSADFIQIAAYFCPMLEELDVTIEMQYQTVDDRYLVKPKHVPYQHLRTLWISDNSILSTADLKLFLENCQELEFFDIHRCFQLSDQLILDALSVNPLKSLQFLAVDRCGLFSIKGIVALLESLDSLNKICINSQHLLPEVPDTVTDLVNQMNWDLDFEFFFDD